MGLETNSHVSDGWPERGMKTENKLTVPEITQVQQLIAPLRKNPQTVLNESDNDQETANGRQITRTRGRDTVSAHWTGLEAFATNSQTNVRLNRVSQCVQPVLNLAGLLPNGVQRTRITGRVCPRRTPSEGVLVSEIIARGAADLRHGGQLDNNRGGKMGETKRYKR